MYFFSVIIPSMMLLYIEKYFWLFALSSFNTSFLLLISSSLKIYIFFSIGKRFNLKYNFIYLFNKFILFKIFVLLNVLYLSLI